MKGSEIVCQIDRILPAHGYSSGNLYLTWNVTDCPRGYDSIGDGVAFVLIPPRGYKRTKSSGKPDPQAVPKTEVRRGVRRISWTEKSGGDIMLIFRLPHGYALHSVDQVDPIPWVAKVFNGRMTLFWSLKGGLPRVSCTIGPIEETEIDALGTELNSELAQRDPPAMPSMIYVAQNPPDPQKPMSLNPFDILERALKEVPALKYALGVLGIVAVIAIVAGLRVDFRIAAFGVIVVLILMVLLLVFARLATAHPTTFLAPIQVLMWTAVAVGSVSGLLLCSSAFFNWPLDLQLAIHSPVQPNSYNINITPDRSLRAWITLISKLKPDPGYSAVFTDCDGVFLDEKVQAGELTAGTRKDLINNLQYNLAPGQPTVRYSVAELKEKGIYEIKCEK